MALDSSELGVGKATGMQCGSRQFTLLYIYFPSHFFQLLNVSSLEYSFSLWVWCQLWQCLCCDAATKVAATTTTKILVPRCDTVFWHQIIFSRDFSSPFFYFYFLPLLLKLILFFFPWYKREMLVAPRDVCILAHWNSRRVVCSAKQNW